MGRLNHPVYRSRVVQMLADAAARSRSPTSSPSSCASSTSRSGWPHRYEVLFAQSVGFVVAGKLVVFAAFGLYQKWWRYVSGRDFLLIVRAVAVSSALLVIVFAVVQAVRPRRCRARSRSSTSSSP